MEKQQKTKSCVEKNGSRWCVIVGTIILLQPLTNFLILGCNWFSGFLIFLFSLFYVFMDALALETGENNDKTSKIQWLYYEPWTESKIKIVGNSKL